MAAFGQILERLLVADNCPTSSPTLWLDQRQKRPLKPREEFNQLLRLEARIKTADSKLRMQMTVYLIPRWVRPRKRSEFKLFAVPAVD